jgi:enoyl-CoA hydratase/carnithine racemase
MELMTSTRVQVPPVIHGTSLRAFAREFEHASRTDGRRVVLVEGSNGIFCRGMDLMSVAEARDGTGPPPEHRAELEEFAACLLRIRRSPVPVIAIVDGEVLAGGVGIAAACDLVVATPRSTFGLSEILFGLVPAIILPLLLERMPAQKVRLWALEGLSHAASEAQKAGLIDVLAEPSEIERLVQGWVRRFSRADRDSVARLKQLSTEMPEPGLQAALRRGVRVTTETLSLDSTWRRIHAFHDGGTAPWEGV